MIETPPVPPPDREYVLRLREIADELRSMKPRLKEHTNYKRYALGNYAMGQVLQQIANLILMLERDEEQT